MLQGLFWGSVSILFPPTPLLPHSIVNWKLVTWWNINGKKKKKKKDSPFFGVMGHSNLQGSLLGLGYILFLVHTFLVLEQSKTSFNQNKSNHTPQSKLNGGGQVTLTFSPP